MWLPEGTVVLEKGMPAVCELSALMNGEGGVIQ